MTISAYQVDNVIKAYSKQSKVHLRSEQRLPGTARTGPADSVSLSGKPVEENVYRKISYTLLDLLKK